MLTVNNNFVELSMNKLSSS